MYSQARTQDLSQGIRFVLSGGITHFDYFAWREFSVFNTTLDIQECKLIRLFQPATKKLCLLIMRKTTRAQRNYQQTEERTNRKVRRQIFSYPKSVCVLVSSTERAELAGRLEVTEQQVSVGLRSMNSR